MQFNQVLNSNLQNINFKKTLISSVVPLQYTFKHFICVNAHLGNNVKRWNPNLKVYLFASRNGMHVLNLQSTTFVFRRLFYLLTLIIKLRKSLLFVSENKNIDFILKKIVLNFGQHITSNRWIGGTISNFKSLFKYIYYLLRKRDPFGLLSKKKKKLQIIFDGIKNLFQLPFLIVILNGQKSKWAINEIRNFNLLCAAIIDSNNNSTLLNYSIPGNVTGFASQIFYIKLFEQASLNALLGEKKIFLIKKRKNYIKYLNNLTTCSSYFHINNKYLMNSKKVIKLLKYFIKFKKMEKIKRIRKIINSNYIKKKNKKLLYITSCNNLYFF